MLYDYGSSVVEARNASYLDWFQCFNGIVYITVWKYVNQEPYLYVGLFDARLFYPVSFQRGRMRQDAAFQRRQMYKRANRSSTMRSCARSIRNW